MEKAVIKENEKPIKDQLVETQHNLVQVMQQVEEQKPFVQMMMSMQRNGMLEDFIRWKNEQQRRNDVEMRDADEVSAIHERRTMGADHEDIMATQQVIQMMSRMRTDAPMDMQQATP